MPKPISWFTGVSSSARNPGALFPLAWPLQTVPTSRMSMSYTLGAWRRKQTQALVQVTTVRAQLGQDLVRSRKGASLQSRHHRVLSIEMSVASMKIEHGWTGADSYSGLTLRKGLGWFLPPPTFLLPWFPCLCMEERDQGAFVISLHGGTWIGSSTDQQSHLVTLHGLVMGSCLSLSVTSTRAALRYLCSRVRKQIN